LNQESLVVGGLDVPWFPVSSGRRRNTLADCVPATIVFRDDVGLLADVIPAFVRTVFGLVNEVLCGEDRAVIGLGTVDR
jgi:hypothetical protein